ncbi:hypothetical protein TIFTF001_046367 [Ficus carica]|uniref:Uncharacterized protein n=1 Tax=Ficus carica TaxID=3494 RepID=A0AA87ZBW8_FICCA|nr:hypothetical protein TIFTF001_046367 [Ficus carica]
MGTNCGCWAVLKRGVSGACKSTEQQRSSRWARREGEVGRWVHSTGRNQGQFHMDWAYSKPNFIYCITVQWKVKTKCWSKQSLSFEVIMAELVLSPIASQTIETGMSN